jgi:aminomethyltransferase
MSLKRTPLYEMHLKYGGKMVDFGGWELPVQYQGIIKEHDMVRQKAGLFDVSHMGEIDVQGEKAQDFIRSLVTNNIQLLEEHQIQYTPMCYPHGGVVDDLLVYKYSPTHFLLVVNAANESKDYAWIKEHVQPGVEVQNVSAQFAQLAIQGPLAEEILQKITDTDLRGIKFFYFKPDVKVAGVECLVSRTGYTGEDGFELYLQPDNAPRVWEALLQAGGDNISPAGLGARDLLRFEAKLPLYGQEMDQDVTPLEAGLGFFVKLDGPDFIGKEALVKQKQAAAPRMLIEFEMIDKGIPRSHYPVQKDGQQIGWVTSGSHSPTLGKSVGLALVKRDAFQEGGEIDIIIREKPFRARMGKGIFYQKKTKK